MKRPLKPVSQLWHGSKQGRKLLLISFSVVVLLPADALGIQLHYIISLFSKQPKYAILTSCSMTFLEGLLLYQECCPDSNLQISDSNQGSRPRWVRKKPSRHRSVDERILCSWLCFSNHHIIKLYIFLFPLVVHLFPNRYCFTVVFISSFCQVWGISLFQTSLLKQLPQKTH